MNKITRNIACAMFILFFSVDLFSAQPLLSITPLFNAPSQLAPNSFTAAIYQVTNNSKTLSSFAMQAIPGVAQVTTIAGSCGTPIQLASGQSCQLAIKITAAQMVGNITSGPVVCNNAPQPMSCSQPSAANSLNIIKLITPLVQNNWISVLIAQDPPPDDIATYMNQIISLAPSLKQIHLRFTPGATNYSLYVNLMNLLHTAYGSSLTIGFHPDNSSSSYEGWNCSTPTNSSSCVLNASIKAMNAMNAIADPHGVGLGFTLFSLEQGDVEIVPSTPTNFQNVKACLNPAVAAGGSVCPVCTTCTPTTVYASPVVSFGDVTQSYGADYYGTTMLDYTYPQFYNLGKKLAPYQDLFTNDFFPSYSTGCATYSTDLYVVDVDNSNTPYSPEIPCIDAGQTYSDVYTYLDPTTHQLSPSLVASYMSYLMTQYPPIAVTIPLSGSTAYITFSGENFIFGAPGWTLGLLSQFFIDLNTDFVTLRGIYPALFPDDGTDPSTLQYAIWNFSSMLSNV